MNKIVIIGCPGSGKSTLARKLGEKLGIPVHHLDLYFWKENWTPTPQDEFRRIQNELMREDAWILDGNFTNSLDNRIPKADTVVFLDMPKLLIIWRNIKRYVRDRKGPRSDMGGNNTTPKWEHIKFTLNYPSAKVYQLLKQHGGGKRVIVLHTPKEVRHFLDNVS